LNHFPGVEGKGKSVSIGPGQPAQRRDPPYKTTRGPHQSNITLVAASKKGGPKNGFMSNAVLLIKKGTQTRGH